MAEWNENDPNESERALGKKEGDDPSSIRAEINQTRGRLSDTLSEIGERLNPHVVKEQVTERVKESIREATIGRVEHMARSAADSVKATRAGISDTIRDNPVPAAMVAVGLAWLLFNGKRGERGQSAGRYDAGDSTRRFRETGAFSRSGTFAGSYPYDPDYEDSKTEGFTAHVADEVRERVSNARERVSSAAETVADTVKDRAGRIADRGRDLVDRAGSSASHMASNVSSRAQDMSRTVANRTTQGARRVEETFYDNPLAIGAVSVALGVMAGLAAPTTDREVEFMGDARERVVDKAREVAHEAKDKALHVADRVIDETKRVVKEEGVTLNGAQGGAMANSGAQAQNPS